MATGDYCDLATVKQRLSITDSSHDSELSAMITAASRAIDRWCHRPALAFVAQTQTRTIDVPASGSLTPFLRDASLVSARYAGDWGARSVWSVNLDDSGPPLLSVPSSVTTDGNQDGVYETTWTSLTDYDLMPTNAPADGLPYRVLRVLPWGRYAMPVGPRVLQITGSWGESATTPPPILEACYLTVIRLFKRRLAPYAIVEDQMGQATRIPAMDPDVRRLLSDAGYIRSWNVV